jgi:hypothetical protein
LLGSNIVRELAAMDLAEARQVQGELRAERQVAHTMIDSVERLFALAEGREQIDLSEAQTRLANARENIDELRRSGEERKGELDDPINQLTAENEQDQAAVDRLVKEATDLRRQASDLGPGQGFPAYEQAVDLEREADGYEYRIAQREIELDYDLEPERRLAESRIEQATSLEESLDGSEQGLASFVQGVEEDASRTRQDASSAASGLRERIRSISARVLGDDESTLQAIYAQAIEHSERAAQDARSASSGLRESDQAAARLAQARADALRGSSTPCAPPTTRPFSRRRRPTRRRSRRSDRSTSAGVTCPPDSTCRSATSRRASTSRWPG